MQTPTISTMINWQRQEAKDALAWHKANGITDPQKLADFEAGFLDGWRKCMSTLVLHTKLRFPDPKQGETIK